MPDAYNPSLSDGLMQDYFLPEKEEKSIMATTVESAESKTPANFDAPVESSEVVAAAVNGTGLTSDASAKISEESSVKETSGDQDPDDEMLGIKIETAPADFRFPTTNQTRHCFTRYIEYHRCVAAKGDDAPECDKFAKYYRALCPGEWVDRWNEQRENGTFPGPL
ncbi:hypothetical protein Leryth_016936 [Lithospermum erythrorhizon]|nr:hypothetical protein Leryth_016936 [Lithospermum erythrorhizon]